MATVFDVAKYILHKEGAISTWKLQKLCYYAQAWSLAWIEKALFAEEFEAWVNGPVCRELFEEHKGSFIISENDLKRGNASNLTTEDKDTIDIVLRDYGAMQPYELRELTHKEAPWLDARKGLPDSANCSQIIDKASIGAYYGSL